MLSLHHKSLSKKQGNKVNLLWMLEPLGHYPRKLGTLLRKSTRPGETPHPPPPKINSTHFNHPGQVYCLLFLEFREKLSAATQHLEFRLLCVKLSLCTCKTVLHCYRSLKNLLNKKLPRVTYYVWKKPIHIQIYRVFFKKEIFLRGIIRGGIIRGHS